VLFYVALSAGICLFFWAWERCGHHYADFFNRYVGWYYYLGTLLFALAHLGNYAQQPPLCAVLLLVLPQLIGGLAYGYLRIQLGFWYGVLEHNADQPAVHCWRFDEFLVRRARRRCLADCSDRCAANGAGSAVSGQHAQKGCGPLAFLIGVSVGDSGRLGTLYPGELTEP
jgi:hypothetical protein